MPHQRKVIRDKVRDLLIAGGTAAGSRVYVEQRLAIRTKDLPVLLVYTTDEAVAAESASTAPRELTREVTLVIEGRVAPGSGGGTPEDAIDALALQVEAVMHASPYLDGTAVDSILDATITDVDTEGDRLTGSFAMTYTVTYRTDLPVEAEDLDDFEVAGVTHNLGGTTHEDDHVHDEVVVQEVAP